MWVLNIDDDRDDREMFCDALKDIDPDIDCIGKESAEDALRYLNTSATLPTYIFLDINMPKVGGIECLKTLKGNDKFAGIPVIIFSTSVNKNEIAQVRKLGADYLAKDSTYSKYVASLKRKIER